MSIPARNLKMSSKDYRIIKDVSYIHQNSTQTEYDIVNKAGHSDKKFTTDIYLPLADQLDSGSNTKERPRVTDQRSRPPLVVFVHGGGWRRGDKDGWKHFVSDDINLLVAFIYWIQGLYGNIGAAFARRGIPCAVMSYPLARLKSPWILFELFTSYVCSVMFLGIISTLIFLMFSFLDLMTPFCLYNHISVLSHIKYVSSSSAMSMALLHLALSNVVILCVIIAQYKHYRLTKNSISMVLLAFVVTLTILNNYQAKYLLNFYVVSLVASQGILFVSNVLSHQASPLEQKQCLQRCLTFLQQLGEGTGWFDPQSIFLMGHSAGGHLCSLAVLDPVSNEKGIHPSAIKGVIAISAVLSVQNMNFDPVKRLYLHPSFGTDPESWQSVCPLHHLKSRDTSDGAPHFLVLSAQYDFHLVQDAVSFSKQLGDFHQTDVEHRVIPRANHTSIICNIDRSSGQGHPSVLSICLQYIASRMSQG